MRAFWLGIMAVATVLAAGPPAHAAYEIEDFRGAVYREGVQDETNYADEAGEHPHTGVVEFAFTTQGSGAPVGVTKDLRVDIPPGLIPNPEAFPRCTDAQLEANVCPAEAQVGTQELAVWAKIGLTPQLAIPQRAAIRVPIYNMTVAPDQVARFSFNPGGAPLAQLVPFHPRMDAQFCKMVGGWTSPPHHEWRAGQRIDQPGPVPIQFLAA